RGEQQALPHLRRRQERPNRGGVAGMRAVGGFVLRRVFWQAHAAGSVLAIGLGCFVEVGTICRPAITMSTIPTTSVPSAMVAVCAAPVRSIMAPSNRGIKLPVYPAT